MCEYKMKLSFQVLISIRQNFQAERAISYKTDEATRSGVYTVASGRAKEGIWDDKHPNFKVCKYTSPAVADRSGKDWVTGVKMYQNNIGVEVSLCQVFNYIRSVNCNS